jgi:hypothetical protein
VGGAFEGSDPSSFSCYCSSFASVFPFSALKYEIYINKILRSNYYNTENTNPSITNTVKICNYFISDLRREVDICVLTECYVACSGNSLPTFRDNLSFPYLRV